MIKKRSPLKIQKIIKARCPSRQLLETVNFAFMKIFDFLDKTAIFRTFLLFFQEISIKRYGHIRSDWNT